MQSDYLERLGDRAIGLISGKGLKQAVLRCSKGAYRHPGRGDPLLEVVSLLTDSTREAEDLIRSAVC